MVGVLGDEILFAKELEPVGKGLQPAELSADAGRAETILDAGCHLAFEPDGEDGGDQQEGDQHERSDERSEEAGQGSGQAEALETIGHGTISPKSLGECSIPLPGRALLYPGSTAAASVRHRQKERRWATSSGRRTRCCGPCRPASACPTITVF